MKNFRKGQKVLINSEYIKYDIIEKEKLKKKFNILVSFTSFLDENDRNPELLKRSLNNEIATITGTVGGDYANIIFDDGFECGIYFSGLIKK